MTLHWEFIGSDDLPWIEDFLTRGAGSGRLRFIKSFPSASSVDQHVDLYAVVKNEPNATSE